MKCKQIGRDKELFELTIGRDLPCRELETERRMRLIFRLVCLFVPDFI